MPEKMSLRVDHALQNISQEAIQPEDPPLELTLSLCKRLFHLSQQPLPEQIRFDLRFTDDWPDTQAASSRRTSGSCQV